MWQQFDLFIKEGHCRTQEPAGRFQHVTFNASCQRASCFGISEDSDWPSSWQCVYFGIARFDLSQDLPYI